jgi:hypothetical protein
MVLKVNYKELQFIVCDYLEHFDRPEYTSKSRTMPCIAPFPYANATCFWVWMNIINHKQVCWSQWAQMVSTELTIVALNKIDVTQIEPIDLAMTTKR